MKLSLRLRAQSVGVALLARRSLGRGGWTTRHERVERISRALPTGKRLQPATIVHIFVLILIGSFVYPTGAVTLQQVLRTTLDNNAAILEAKAGLEQAAGQRLLFRSIVWPDFDLASPPVFNMATGLGRAAQKDLLWVAAIWNRRCSTWLCLLRFGAETLRF